MDHTLSPDMHTNALSDMNGLPFDADTMFVNHKGVHKPGIEKKQRALAKKVAFLDDFLEQGEKLLVITTAVSPTSFLEQWTTGIAFVYIKRCMLVLTDRRIFHIPMTMSFKYRRSIAQVRYNDIESIAQKGARLKISYKSGDKETFLYIRRAERKKIKALLPSLETQGAPSQASGRVHMCPRCASDLQPANFTCASCGLEFKSRKKALMLSIWLPGGGYFYTGHPLLGSMDALVELFLVLSIIGSLIATPDFPAGDVASAIAFGVILALEKLITVYHAYHFVSEYLTKDKVIEQVTNYKIAKAS